jgi:hypothetical protein
MFALLGSLLSASRQEEHSAAGLPLPGATQRTHAARAAASFMLAQVAHCLRLCRRWPVAWHLRQLAGSEVARQVLQVLAEVPGGQRLSKLVGLGTTPDTQPSAAPAVHARTHNHKHQQQQEVGLAACHVNQAVLVVEAVIQGRSGCSSNKRPHTGHSCRVAAHLGVFVC